MVWFFVNLIGIVIVCWFLGLRIKKYVKDNFLGF